jgi:hypothetical protein
MGAWPIYMNTCSAARASTYRQRRPSSVCMCVLVVERKRNTYSSYEVSLVTDSGGRPRTQAGQLGHASSIHPSHAMLSYLSFHFIMPWSTHYTKMIQFWRQFAVHTVYRTITLWRILRISHVSHKGRPLNNPITITILDIIHRPVSYLKYDVSEIGFCFRLQVEPTRIVCLRRQPFSIVPIWVSSTWRRRQTAVSETCSI